jgi:cytochrome d ubiquinol oxidase subunit I
MLLLSGVGLWLLHRRRLASSRGFLAVGLWSLFLPYSMLLAGWVLAETGRQPWVVWELQKTADAVSPSVSRTEVAFTLGAFVVLYAVLVSVNFVLMRRFARRDLEPVPEFEDPDGPGGPGGPGDRTPLDLPALSY